MLFESEFLSPFAKNNIVGEQGIAKCFKILSEAVAHLITQLRETTFCSATRDNFFLDFKSFSCSAAVRSSKVHWDFPRLIGYSVLPVKFVLMQFPPKWYPVQMSSPRRSPTPILTPSNRTEQGA